MYKIIYALLFIMLVFTTNASHAWAQNLPTGASYSEAPDPPNNPLPNTGASWYVPDATIEANMSPDNTTNGNAEDYFLIDSDHGHVCLFVVCNANGGGPQYTLVSGDLVFAYPGDTIPLLNDGLQKDGSATMRIVARPGDQCFTAGLDYYYTWTSSTTYVPHGRFFVLDWCKNGAMVFSKELGNHNWGPQHNLTFSQAYVQNGLMIVNGQQVTIPVFIAYVYNMTPNECCPNNPKVGPATGEGIALSPDTGVGNYIVFLKGSDNQYISEPIDSWTKQGTVSQPTWVISSGNQTQYPSARTGFEMSYKNYTGTNNQCVNIPGYWGVQMDTYDFNILASGSQYVTYDTQFPNFWYDVSASRNNIQIYSPGCLYTNTFPTNGYYYYAQSFLPGGLAGMWTAYSNYY